MAAIRGLVLPAPSRGVVLRASAGTPLGGRPPAEGESRPLRVLGPPAALRVVAGDGQGAPAGTVLPERPAVRVTDRVGNALPGLAVAFDVTSYGSSWRMVPTDTDGVARTPWRLGPRAGAICLPRPPEGSARFWPRWPAADQPGSAATAGEVGRVEWNRLN